MLYSMDDFIYGMLKFSAAFGFVGLWFYFVGLICWACYSDFETWIDRRKDISRLRLKKLEQDKTMPVCKKWGTDACDRQGCAVIGKCIDIAEASNKKGYRA